jgi:hypothetical protein
MRKLEGIDGGKERGEKIERQLLRKAKKKKRGISWTAGLMALMGYSGDIIEYLSI